MRVCSPQLGISPRASLGGEVFDRELLRALAGEGVEIEILLPKEQPCPAVPGWSVTRLPLRRGYRWWVSNLVLVPYIGRAYRRRRFDVLRVHSLRFTGLAALWARRFYRLPVPIVAHHHHLEEDGRSWRIEGRVAARVDLLLTGSDFARRQLVTGLGVDERKVAVVPYGVVLPTTGEVTRAPHRDGPTLLHVGSLIARKRLPLLLQALWRVRQEWPRARLVLVGTGGAESELRRQAARLGLGEAVDFTGTVGEEEKHDLLRCADLFVAPSALEGFGLAVGEAMASGLPVVAARAGALPELLAGGEAGLIVEPEDPEALARGILRLLADSDLRQRLAAAGERRARQHYSWEVAARRTKTLYEGARCGSAS